MRPAPLKFLSMVSHKDLIFYLLAIKSIYFRIGEGSAFIIDDGSLTEQDRALIAYHLPLNKIISIHDVDVGPCPHGGTWERLVTILDLTADEYVIQVDSDTLATDLLPVVETCYRENRAFTLAGSEPGNTIIVAEKAAAYARTFVGDRVSVLGEVALGDLKNATTQLYVRGSSGFAGFSRGQFGRDLCNSFSQEMQSILGDVWNQWGSEQIASNFLVANTPNAVVLPIGQYACFEPGLDVRGTVFLHFYGTYRYRQGVYGRKGREVVNELQAALGRASA